MLGGKLPQIPDHEECMFHRRSYEGYDGCPPYDGMLEWPALVRSLDRDCAGWRGDQREVEALLGVGSYVAAAVDW